MASNTSNLNLYKKDPIVDGNDTFNIKTMLNDNWDKIDLVVTAKADKADFSSHQAEITTQLKNLTSQGAIQKVVLTNVVPTVDTALAGTLYLVYE